MAQKSWPSGAPARAAAACSAETPGLTTTSTRAQPGRGRGRAARRRGSPARRCRDRRSRPGRPGGPRRRAPARTRQRSSSAPSGKSWRGLPAAPAADQVEIEAVADQVLGFGQQPLAPRRCARPARRGRGRRPRAGPAAGRRRPDRGRRARGPWRRWRARPCCLVTSSRPPVPAAASAAPSATPQQPVCAEHQLRAGSPGAPSPRSSRCAGKKRAGTPRSAASACTAGSAAFRSIETTQAMAARASPRCGQASRRPAPAAPGGHPASAPTPSARTGGW